MTEFKDYPDWALPGLIPLSPDTNRPFTEGWQNIYKVRKETKEDRFSTLQDAEEWESSGHNTGLVVPDSCLVLDWDVKNLTRQGHSQEDIEAISEYLLEDLPNCAVQKTRSGGMHFWFKVNPKENFKSTTNITLEIEGEDYIFDIRSGGRSQVCVSPSKNYHWLRQLPSSPDELPLRPDSLLKYQDKIVKDKSLVYTTDYGPRPTAFSRPAADDYKPFKKTNLDLYNALKANKPLARPGGRNDALMRSVGIVMRVLCGPDRPPHPEVPYYILASAVESDTTEDAPTLDNLWDMCCRVTDNHLPQWREDSSLNKGIKAIQARLKSHSMPDPVEVDETDLDELAREFRTTPDQLPEYLLLIDHSGSYWVLDVELGGYRGPFKREAVLKAMVKHGQHLVDTDQFYHGKQASMRPMHDLINDFGQQIMSVRYEARTQQPIFLTDEYVLVRPAWQEDDLTPEFNPQIDEWMRHFAGNDYTYLRDWLATVPLTTLPTSCLYLHGPTGAGKTMLVSGLGRFWKGPAVPYQQAIADFNSGLLTSPLVFIEEGLNSRTDSQKFRDLLTAGTHDIRMKYQAPGELRGHVRMIVAANNPNALKLNEDMTHSDREAVSRRILWIEVNQKAAHYLSSIGGRQTTEAWVSGGGIARHIKYLQMQYSQDVTQQMDRWLVQGNSSSTKTRAMLSSRISRTTLRIVAEIVKNTAFGRPKSPAGQEFVYKDNSVFVRWSSVYKQWRTDQNFYGKVPSSDLGENTLQGLSTDRQLAQEDSMEVFHKIDRELLLDEVRAQYQDENVVEKVNLYLKSTITEDRVTL